MGGELGSGDVSSKCMVDTDVACGPQIPGYLTVDYPGNSP